MELMPPPKADALAHLDSDGPAPKRYARVTVIRGSHKDCMDYQVSGWCNHKPSLAPEGHNMQQCRCRSKV